MSALHTLSIGALARELSAGAVSSREVTALCLARIRALDGRLGAFLHVDTEGALAAARASDARRAKGQARGLLDGVPVALKDNLCTRGVPTTCGSKILEGFVPPYDAAVVEKLAEAGAVVLGKLNQDEFAMGSSTETSAFRTCRNPWDLARTPGGSSGGSAAAVSAGLCFAALGTDTGGSIRQPASFCGVTGIKPTYGRCSRYGLIAFASSLDQVGPLARSAQDAALVLQAIAGHDPRDSTSLPSPLPSFVDASRGGSLEGVRLGVPREYFIGGVDAEVEGAVRAALGVLERLGATLVELSLPHTAYATATYYVIASAECSANLSRFDGVRFGRSDRDGSLRSLYEQTRANGLGGEVKRRILLGTFALSAGYYDAYYLRAQKVRTLLRRDFDAAFEAVDAIVTPTSPTTAFALGERIDDPLRMYLADTLTLSCNLAGLPGMSVPCGFSTSDLPIGLQLLGRPLDEASLFRVAAAYQAQTDFHTRAPPEPA